MTGCSESVVVEDVYAGESAWQGLYPPVVSARPVRFPIADGDAAPTRLIVHTNRGPNATPG
ncbi:hypothetical protein TPA0908_07740 [Micromonospora sp. AKA38]|nr:hypothetical protein TPA0908_07740 [Micromonospora sp. AKA38]